MEAIQTNAFRLLLDDLEMMYVEIFNGIIEYYEPKIMCGGLEDIIFNESSYVPEINSLARISLARIYPDCYWMVLE